MSTKMQRFLVFCLVAVLIVIIIFGIILITKVNDNQRSSRLVYVTEEPKVTPKVIYVTPEPQPEVTPQVIYVTVEPKPEVTPEVVYITPEPQPEVTPQVIYVAKPDTTQDAISETPKPIIQVFQDDEKIFCVNLTTGEILWTRYLVTEAPVIPAAVPTPVPIVAPIVAPTPVSTAVPTVEPTKAPFVFATTCPTAVPQKVGYAEIKAELEKACIGNEVYPSYDDYPTGFPITLKEGVDQNKLFDEVLAPFFVNVVAHSFEFDFTKGKGITGERALKNVLDSSANENGYLTLTYNKGQTSKMQDILSSIKDKAYANELMLEWLNNHSAPNPINSSERLFLVE